MSNAGSEISAASSFLTASQLTRLPDPDKGYDFAKHFNVFSQYTSNMALEFCVDEKGSENHGPVVPPVWCMAFWNRVVAVGCGNGQLEVRGGREGGKGRGGREGRGGKGARRRKGGRKEEGEERREVGQEYQQVEILSVASLQV